MEYAIIVLLVLGFIWAVYDAIPDSHKPKLRPNRKYKEEKLPAIERLEDITE
jgi:hypothetical protein